MSTVMFDLAISVDGIMGGRGEQAWAVHDRLLGWVHELSAWRERSGAGDSGLQNVDNDVVLEATANVGAYVMGHRMFSYGVESWGEHPPFQAPVFVLTSRLRPVIAKQGGTSYTFVTEGIEAAVAAAKQAAGNRRVRLAGGASIVQQALRARLVDEFELHVIPVLLGEGVRLFDAIGDTPLELTSERTINATGITHAKYRIAR